MEEDAEHNGNNKGWDLVAQMTGAGFGSCAGCHEVKWLTDSARRLCVECKSTAAVLNPADPRPAESVLRVQSRAELTLPADLVRRCITCGAEQFMQANHERCPACYEDATGRRGCCVNCGVDRPAIRGQRVCAECDADPDAVRHRCEKCGSTSRKARKTSLCNKCAQKEPGSGLRHAKYYFERRYRRGKLGRKPSRGELAQLARGLWDSLSPRHQKRLRKDLRNNNFNSADPFDALVDYAQVTCWKVAAQLKKAEAKEKRSGEEKPKLSGSSVWTVRGGLPSLGKR